MILEWTTLQLTRVERVLILTRIRTRNWNNKAEKSYFRYNRYSQTSRKENERLLEVVVFFPITTINITFKANKCLINYGRNYHYTTGLIAKATSFWTVARVWPMSSNKISVPRTSPVHLHRYLECGERGGYWTLTSRKNTTIDLCIAGRKRLAESGERGSCRFATSARFDITSSVNSHSLGGTGDSYAHFSLPPPNFLRTCASDNRETRACCFLKFSRKRISFDNLIRFHV